MEDNIETIRNELEEAQQDLHQTVADLNQRAKDVTEQLQPEHLVEHHLPLAAALAGTLGFAIGNSGERPGIMTTLVVGGLIAAILGKALKYEFGDHATQP